MNNKLFFCVGLARSGKDTFIQKWLRERENDEIRQVVHADSIRLALGHRYNSCVEGLVYEFKKIWIRSLLKIDNVHVIVNGTHTSEKSIKEILQIDINAQPILIPTTPEICIERAKATGQPDLERPITRMAENLEALVKIYTRTTILTFYDFKWERDVIQENVEKAVNNIRKYAKPEKHCISD
jgi:hypothetical protein